MTSAATGASTLVVLTEWDEFRWLDFSRVLALMEAPSIVDARNLLDPAALRRIGFSYTGSGADEPSGGGGWGRVSRFPSVRPSRRTG